MTSQYARNTAVFAALHTHYWNNGTGAYIKPNDLSLIKFAPLLAGLLLCLVIAITLGVCILMREKRKRIQEATSLSNLPWLDTLEVFAVSGTEGAPAMFLPMPGGPVVPSPPPAYETVIKINEKDEEAKRQDKLPAAVLSPMRRPTLSPLPPLPAAVPPDDLPPYEVAVKMNGNI